MSQKGQSHSDPLSIAGSLTFELDYLPKSLLHINPLIYQLD